MFERHARAAFLAVAFALSGGIVLAQSPDSATKPDPQRPPTIIVPPKPASPPAPPPRSRRDEPRADFCCTPYGRFGPVGGSGRPGAPCQWTLPGSVTQGSTCD
jgi:hypothetical protein